MRDAIERITHALLSIPNANAAAAAAKNGNSKQEGDSQSLPVAATEKEASLTALEKSFILSADMAHAVHNESSDASMKEEAHLPIFWLFFSCMRFQQKLLLSTSNNYCFCLLTRYMFTVHV